MCRGPRWWEYCSPLSSVQPLPHSAEPSSQQQCSCHAIWCCRCRGRAPSHSGTRSSVLSSQVMKQRCWCAFLKVPEAGDQFYSCSSYVQEERVLRCMHSVPSSPLCADASPVLNAASLAFSRALTSAFNQGFWFGLQVTVLVVVVTSSTHLEMKPRTEEVYSCRSTSPSYASVNTCQYVHCKQSWSRGCIPGPHTQ
ncbi:hypothetical protein XENOCAPTIV_028762 [Xenoophorus captivus]|uniref:Uncharacterized protein n=1 Tax=Xenoophorus captivus TaxID=1517983 RepID=A0ABV0R6V1_9TELE